MPPLYGRERRDRASHVRLVTRQRWVVLLLAVVFAGCNTVSQPKEVDPRAAPVIEIARDDLAARLGLRPDQIVVQDVQVLDGSNGEPAYAIELAAADTVFEYQGSQDTLALVSGKGDTGDEIVTVQRVQITPGQVAVSGQSWLPDGTCLHTRLSLDGQPLSWWPADECVAVEAGRWQIAVPLGRWGAPDELQALVQYRLDVWAAEDDDVRTSFWFEAGDAATPPAILSLMTPGEVTDAFYRWYAGCCADVDPALLRGTFAASAYIGLPLAQRAEERLADGQSATELLWCASPAPRAWMIGQETTAGDWAWVQVRKRPSEEVHVVVLQWIDGQWVIGNVRCGEN